MAAEIMAAWEYETRMNEHLAAFEFDFHSLWETDANMDDYKGFSPTPRYTRAINRTCFVCKKKR